MSVNTESVDDSMIMAAVRRGQSELFGVLYRRHAAVASMYARRLARNGDDANDVVAEAFARVLDILQRGLGPTDEFRPYLMRTVRNITYDRYRADRFIELTDDPADLDGVSEFRDLVIEGVERGLIGQAFRSLPQRWQRVLWLTCVEGHSVDSASQALGINPNAVTSLAYRAREGLRR
ncbi:MAG: RNA polymerase sigma factor, partial [Angustibacter sp.]